MKISELYKDWKRHFKTHKILNYLIIALIFCEFVASVLVIAIVKMTVSWMINVSIICICVILISIILWMIFNIAYARKKLRFYYIYNYFYFKQVIYINKLRGLYFPTKLFESDFQKTKQYLKTIIFNQDKDLYNQMFGDDLDSDGIAKQAA